MFKLIFTNSKGESIELFGHPFRLISVEGLLGDVEAETQMQRTPYQDGEEYIDTILRPRYGTIELKITGSDVADVEAKRRRLSSAFNPKLQLGTLRYERGNEVREIKAISESIPFFPDGTTNRGRTFQKAVINLVCPNPYWRSLHSTSRALQAYVGNFTLPFTLPFELGVEGDRTTLINEGDMPAPVLIDIHGPTVNPRVINRTTGEFIRVNRSIEANEILHIDTTPGEKKVHLYRGNRVIPVFGDLDHDSDFFFLEVGENEIEHVADAGNAHALVAITWQDRFVGV